MIRDMTNGGINRHLLTFTVPLVLGNLFQLTYNAVDSIIVGKFIGTEALAAVGCANPVMNLVILGITGICIGASVLMSSYFGAGDEKRLKQALGTTAVLGILFSVLLVAFGEICSKLMLQMLRVPDDILGLGTVYLRIIFLGMPFTFAYNAYASAMRSVGDSRTPIVFLAFSAVLNGVLDYFLIVVFQGGVTGAAVATVLAQCMSALLCIGYVQYRIPLLRLGWQDIKADKQMMKLTVQNGAITALQQSCQPIGKLLIQGNINTLGIDAIAVFNAVNRVDDFALTPEQSISHAMMTFVSQNRGAGKQQRVKRGLRQGLILEVCYWSFICAVIWLLREPIMGLFVGQKESAVQMGAAYLGLMAFFYLLPAFTNGIQGYCRGLGNMTVTLTATLIQISIRVLFVFLLVPGIGLTGVAYASFAGWACMFLVQIVYIKRIHNKR